MKKVLAVFVASLCVCVGARAQERPVAFEGATLVTISGPAVPDGVLVVHRGKIVAAGPRAAVRVPADAQRVDARGKTIMPGLVDTHSHVGGGSGGCGHGYRLGKLIFE